MNVWRALGQGRTFYDAHPSAFGCVENLEKLRVLGQLRWPGNRLSIRSVS
jgi:hypothetical protein